MTTNPDEHLPRRAGYVALGPIAEAAWKRLCEVERRSGPPVSQELADAIRLELVFLEARTAAT